MLNPAYMPLAFLGGRSWGEIAEGDQARSMDSSIAIGVGALVSAVIIFFGQLLFWRSIPTTQPQAAAIAAVLTLVYVLFYRLLIRSSEVAGWFGKTLLVGAGFCLAGVNALLAGHEMVLLPFAAQVQEMTIHMGDSEVDTLREKTEKSRGLGDLKQRSQQARQDEQAAREQLNTVPTAIQSQQQQAQACDQQAQRMRAALPDPGSPGRESRVAAWREQRRQCARLSASAREALAAHRSAAQSALSVATQSQQAAARQLTQATTESDLAVAAAAPVLTASASTGFGRHKALWAAVAAGKVPGWAAYGLMLVALLLEGAGLLLKLVLPKDEATLARLTEARITQAVGASELAYLRAYAAQLKPAMASQAAQTQTAAERMVKSTLGPSIATRFAADQFARAAASTNRAQRRSGNAATPVIDELAKVMPGDWAQGQA